MENVNHPPHYNQGNVECIDAMEAAFGREAVADFCVINSFKYIWRYKLKNRPVEDLEKSVWYLNKTLELLNL